MQLPELTPEEIKSNQAIVDTVLESVGIGNELMERDRLPSQAENPTGLYGRYVVSKADGSPVDPLAEYFVLRLDERGSDPFHVAACRVAILAYAEAIKSHLPQLAKDIMYRYSDPA